MLEIILPLSLINPEPPFLPLTNSQQIHQPVILPHYHPALTINHNTLPMPLAINKIAIIHGLLVHLELQVRGRMQPIYVNILLVRLVGLEEPYQLLNGLGSLADGADN